MDVPPDAAPPPPSWPAIEAQLRDWLANPPTLHGDCEVNPSLIQRAIAELLPLLTDRPAPARLVPSADNGIVLEWPPDTTVELWADGQAELFHFGPAGVDTRRELLPRW